MTHKSRLACAGSITSTMRAAIPKNEMKNAIVTKVNRTARTRQSSRFRGASIGVKSITVPPAHMPRYRPDSTGAEALAPKTQNPHHHLVRPGVPECRHPHRPDISTKTHCLPHGNIRQQPWKEIRGEMPKELPFR